MDIRDYDALVATVRIRLRELSPAQLAYLHSAVRAEQERRLWPLTVSVPLRPGTAAVTVAATPSTERWRTIMITVNQSWPEYHTPWICSRCGAEWCRIRNLPAQARRADGQSLGNQELQRRWSALQSP